MGLDRTDVPEATHLETIRALVDGVRDGRRTTEALEEATQLSHRHVGYYLHAARVLGFVVLNGTEPGLTEAGARLAATKPESAEEATQLIRAVVSSPVVIQVAGDLLSDKSTKEQLTERIRVLSGLAEATAEKRAGTILAWRAFVHKWASVPSSEPQPSITPAASIPATAASTPSAKATQDAPLLPPAIFAHLAEQMSRGRVGLFTGAGFSMDAKDRSGQYLPSGNQLAREIWRLVYPNDAYEETSSLADLFARGVRSTPRELEALLKTRFTVESASLPEHYATWLSMPWRAVYTLNVDDLPDAVNRRFHLPRDPVLRSAIDRAQSPTVSTGTQFSVVHLNGRIVDGIANVTFDVTQFARRLSDQEPAYATLAADLLAYPFVFVGTPIDETVFWQHIELRSKRGAREHELRPRCFLVSPSLSRARRDLLQEYNIFWVQCAASDFATRVLSAMSSEAKEGLEVAKRAFAREKSDASNIQDVATLVASAGRGKTEFLNGAEPTWGDLLEGRAIARSMDQKLLQQCQSILAKPGDRNNSPATVLLITGTAGSGKSTALMRLAATLSGAGTGIAWVGTDTEVSPRQLREFWRSEDAPAVVAIDDADRYGSGLGPLLGEMARESGGRLLLLGLRASKVDRTLEAADIPDDVPRFEFSVPLLSDDDIDGLLAVLGREKRLGRLTGKTRVEQEQAFREQSGRQLLVAMIQATSGRKFEDKVFEEWSDLPNEGRYIYTLLAFATSLRYKPTKSELLLASGASRDSGELKVLADLVARHIVVSEKQVQDRYAARHRVIAERLVDQLAQHGEQLTKPIANLGFAVSANLSQDTERQEWSFRFVKALMNHDYLFRMCSLDGARTVYDAIEANLSWDHHFWLQRGSLEVTEGDVRRAEQWLETARSLNPNDAYVTTEYAYMLLRKAISTPEAGDAPTWVAEGLKLLRGQIAARGKRDTYPYHILGMQGLGWAAKGRMSKPEKKVFLAAILNDVRDGATKHPHAKELRELRDTLQQELWGLEVRVRR